jgi:hypothetical protein
MRRERGKATQPQPRHATTTRRARQYLLALVLVGLVVAPWLSGAPLRTKVGEATSTSRAARHIA